MIEVPVWLIAALAILGAFLSFVYVDMREELREAERIMYRSLGEVEMLLKMMAKDRDENHALRTRCAALEAELADLNQERGEL